MTNEPHSPTDPPPPPHRNIPLAPPVTVQSYVDPADRTRSWTLTVRPGATTTDLVDAALHLPPTAIFITATGEVTIDLTFSGNDATIPADIEPNRARAEARGGSSCGFPSLPPQPNQPRFRTSQP